MTAQILRATPVAEIGRAEAPSRLPAVLGRSRCFCKSQNAQCSPGARVAPGAARDQSLSPADAYQSQLARDAHTRRTLIMLAQFYAA